MVESIDGGWGSVNDEGTWTGMIGMILRNEIDVAISDFYVTEARSRVVTYSKIIHEERCVLDFDYYVYQIQTFVSILSLNCFN